MSGPYRNAPQVTYKPTLAPTDDIADLTYKNIKCSDKLVTSARKKARAYTKKVVEEDSNDK
jgi:hypothetical protein